MHNKPMKHNIRYKLDGQQSLIGWEKTEYWDWELDHKKLCCCQFIAGVL